MNVDALVLFLLIPVGHLDYKGEIPPFILVNLSLICGQVPLRIVFRLQDITLIT